MPTIHSCDLQLLSDYHMHGNQTRHVCLSSHLAVDQKYNLVSHSPLAHNEIMQNMQIRGIITTN